MMKISTEDNMLIEKYILLPLASKALEADRKAIENSGLKFKEQYLAMIDAANIALQEQMRDVRRACIAKEIKLHRKRNLEYTVFTRGYEIPVIYDPVNAKEKIDKMLKDFWGLPIK